MIRTTKLIVIFLAAILFIWLFGFTLGIIIHALFIGPEAEVRYGMYSYSISRPFPGYYLPGLILSMPLFLILYLLIRTFRSNAVIRNYGMLIAVTIYFMYGILVFGGQFWHLPKLMKGNLGGWLTGEHADLYFGISSLLSVILFTAAITKYLKSGPLAVPS